MKKNIFLLIVITVFLTLFIFKGGILPTYGSLNYTYGEGINRIRISKNFWLDEFQSRKYSVVKVDPKLVIALQLLRDTARVRIRINSGYRTEEEQIKINPYLTNSYHCKGMAADISSPDCDLIYLIEWVSAIPSFKGIGLYDTHIHVDVRPEDREYYWINRDGKNARGINWKEVYNKWKEVYNK